MKLKFDTLKDKINGCWQGKNAGGVLGAPFECRRGLFDITWYTQKDIDRNPPPNDDLDLQIAWLNAVEEYGPTVSASLICNSVAKLSENPVVGDKTRSRQKGLLARFAFFGIGTGA